MADENVDTLRRTYDAINRGDLEGALDLIDPEAEFTSLIAEADGRTYHGHAGAREWWDDISAPLGGLEIRVESMRSIDDETVIAHLVLIGTVGGVRVQQPMWNIARLRDRRLTWWSFGRTEPEALEAAGMVEYGPSSAGDTGPMSQENVDRVRRGVANVDAFWAMLDEYVVWDLRGFESQRADLDEVYIGRDAVIEASRHYFGTWDEYRLDAEELIDAGSSVVVVVHEQGLGKGGGVPIERRFAQMWTFRHGRIIRWDLFPDKKAAIEAAGL